MLQRDSNNSILSLMGFPFFSRLLFGGASAESSGISDGQAQYQTIFHMAFCGYFDPFEKKYSTSTYIDLPN